MLILLKLREAIYKISCSNQPSLIRLTMNDSIFLISRYLIGNWDFKIILCVFPTKKKGRNMESFLLYYDCQLQRIFSRRKIFLGMMFRFFLLLYCLHYCLIWYFGLSLVCLGSFPTIFHWLLILKYSLFSYDIKSVKFYHKRFNQVQALQKFLPKQ